MNEDEEVEGDVPQMAGIVGHNAQGLKRLTVA